MEKQDLIRQPKHVIFFPNGQIAAFDKNGEQIGPLQKSFIEMFFDTMVANGLNPLECEFRMPSGKKAKAIKLDDGGWNWDLLNEY